MPPENDPRTYFAAERTLLAWVRTGTAVMGLGFVVARFGLFLRIAAASVGNQIIRNPESRGHHSSIIGFFLVAVAVLIMMGGAVQHLRFLKTLDPEQLPMHYSPWLGVTSALLLSGIGVLLAVSLLIWSH